MSPILIFVLNDGAFTNYKQRDFMLYVYNTQETDPILHQLSWR